MGTKKQNQGSEGQRSKFVPANPDAINEDLNDVREKLDKVFDAVRERYHSTGLSKEEFKSKKEEIKKLKDEANTEYRKVKRVLMDQIRGIKKQSKKGKTEGSQS